MRASSRNRSPSRTGPSCQPFQGRVNAVRITEPIAIERIVTRAIMSAAMITSSTVTAIVAEPPAAKPMASSPSRTKPITQMATSSRGLEPALTAIFTRYVPFGSVSQAPTVSTASALALSAVRSA